MSDDPIRRVDVLAAVNASLECFCCEPPIEENAPCRGCIETARIAGMETARITGRLCALPADPVAAAASALAEAFHPMNGHTSIYIYDVNGRQQCLICQQPRRGGECEHLDGCEYAAYRAAVAAREGE